MPELAEVEYFRKQWNPGLGGRITAVHVHGLKRVFRGTDVRAMTSSLKGKQLTGSETHGKRMLFRFSGGGWLGVHLGMTGSLKAVAADHEPGQHDHLVLFQAAKALVFCDPRQFGRVEFASGKQVPTWWRGLPPSPADESFTAEIVEQFLERHARLPIKAALLSQEGFPGIGNWMADEILWQAKLHPARRVAALNRLERKALWRQARAVSRKALETIGVDWSDPPKGWFFHERWGGQGRCPKHRTLLQRETIGGRTTAWCAKCQG
jgi:formamidopyrimidine-DNA glycosylase